jgi:hypothetical protein
MSYIQHIHNLPPSFSNHIFLLATLLLMWESKVPTIHIPYYLEDDSYIHKIRRHGDKHTTEGRKDVWSVVYTLYPRTSLNDLFHNLRNANSISFILNPKGVPSWDPPLKNQGGGPMRGCRPPNYPLSSSMRGVMGPPPAQQPQPATGRRGADF